MPCGAEPVLMVKRSRRALHAEGLFAVTAGARSSLSSDAYQSPGLAFFGAREPCAPVDALPPGAGGRFAALMQRSWGARRTVNPGLLVLSMLHEEVRRRLLTAWLDAGSGSSSFFAAEADTLLDFIAYNCPPIRPNGRSAGSSSSRCARVTARAHSSLRPPRCSARSASSVGVAMRGWRSSRRD